MPALISQLPAEERPYESDFFEALAVLAELRPGAQLAQRRPLGTRLISQFMETRTQAAQDAAHGGVADESDASEPETEDEDETED